MKGIILAGGNGTRLYPMTKVLSKQLLPVYDKPMIYYPLSILMLANIKNILIISSYDDSLLFQKMFSDGHTLGINISYAIQDKPKGIADAFIIAKRYIDNDNVALILGDNIFYGSDFANILSDIMNIESEAKIFGYYVNNPKDYGIAEIDSNNNIISIIEKPEHPKSNYAIPGLYFYDNSVLEIVKCIKPSIRGELEISSINMEYVKQKKIKIHLLDKSFTWIDVGNPERLLLASNIICDIQKKHGNYIACLEEIAYIKGFIDKSQLIKLAEDNPNITYRKYLLCIE